MLMPYSNIFDISLCSEPISVIQKPAVKCMKYQGLYEFDPRNPDELAIKEGDVIVVCKM